MKARVVARCQACGAEVPRWVGRCPECGRWGSVVEGPAAQGPKPPAPGLAPALIPLEAHGAAACERLATGLDELDRVLGGGLVESSVVLVAGEPGIGKSTLTLQVAASAAASRDVVLVCGEETPQQVRARADRVGGVRPRMRALAATSMDAVEAAIAAHPRALVVVDSVQTLHDPELPPGPGSVTQVRHCCARLAAAARQAGATVLAVGHVTKDGAVAGPRTLEHLVDVVLSFEGDRQGPVRVVRALKNRFGSTLEAGYFEMTEAGLQPIRDASAYLLADRRPGEPGSVLAAAVDGRRPLVLEVQALVAPSGLSVPRRVALGVDPNRLAVLAAVCARRAHLRLSDRDVFVSAVGGLRAEEPAVDLAICLAMISSYADAPLPADLVAFGEVGLAGEVRGVPASDRRLAEARKAGCSRAVVPPSTPPLEGLELIRVGHLREALALFGRRRTSLA